MPTFIDDHFRALQRVMLEEINALHEPEPSGTTAESWIDYFMEKYSIPQIILLERSPRLQSRIEKVPKKTVFGETVMVEEVAALVGLPVEGHPCLHDLLDMRASSWYGVSPEWRYDDDCIVVTVRSTKPAIVEREIGYAKNRIAWMNQDIEHGNRELRTVASEYVRLRIGQVGAWTSSVRSLADVLGAELLPTPGTERRLTEAPRIRDAIAQLRKPQPQRQAIPRMEPHEFQIILDVIDAQGVTFERTPATVAKLGEEDIRNLILGALNAAFNLGAAGEAFSVRGKTDILLAVPDGGIFIAEAKMWNGPKTVADATKQILSYLSWRDAYGLVLLFSRREQFSQVRSQIPAGIRIESLRGDVHQVDEHHWLARHSLPTDQEQTVELHFLVFNIASTA